MNQPVISDKEFRQLLKASSLSSLLERFDDEYRVDNPEPRSTIAERQEALASALSSLDDEKMIELQETLSGYVDTLARAEVEFDASGAELTHPQKVYLMRRYLDTKTIKELAEVVNKGLKRIVGEAVTAKVAAEDPDEEYPEHVSGDIDVPELGKRFCKEGAGRKPPLIDERKLRELLGEDAWSRVTRTRTIPAQEVTEVSEELLMAEAMKDPEVLQKLKAAFIPGGWKSWSFTVRDLKKK